jgi:hypothetical protein
VALGERAPPVLTALFVHIADRATSRPRLVYKKEQSKQPTVKLRTNLCKIAQLTK